MTEFARKTRIHSENSFTPATTKTISPADSGRPFVIGLTGAFGSGCTTAAWILGKSDPPYAPVNLSDELHAEWQTRGETGTPSRGQLQQLGDELRSSDGLEVLAKRPSPVRELSSRRGGA